MTTLAPQAQIPGGHMESTNGGRLDAIASTPMRPHNYREFNVLERGQPLQATSGNPSRLQKLVTEHHGVGSSILRFPSEDQTAISPGSWPTRLRAGQDDVGACRPVDSSRRVSQRAIGDRYRREAAQRRREVQPRGIAAAAMIALVVLDAYQVAAGCADHRAGRLPLEHVFGE